MEFHTRTLAIHAISDNSRQNNPLRHFLPSQQVYGFGAGIFFIGYFLLEIPGSLLVELWSARGWIARIMISWGVLAILMGFITTAMQFYWVCFLLGAAEAGFFPGLIVYLSLVPLRGPCQGGSAVYGSHTHL